MATPIPPPTLSETQPPQPQSTPANPSTMLHDLQTSSPKPSPHSPLPAPIITTPRLILRPMHPQDASSMTTARASPSISQYMTLAFSAAHTLSHAESWISLNTSTPRPSHFVIAEVDHPEIVIGGAGLNPGSDVQSHTAKMGYWLAEDSWGKGYATEVVEGLTRLGFEDGRWERLWADVFGGNRASIRVLEKCGYRAEGVLKGHAVKDGVVSDLHILGLTKGDWEEWVGGKEKK